MMPAAKISYVLLWKVFHNGHRQLIRDSGPINVASVFYSYHEYHECFLTDLVNDTVIAYHNAPQVIKGFKIC